MATEAPTGTPEDRLDAANRATFVKHCRRILDYGLSARNENSALPGILADLQANAQQYAGDLAPKRRAGAPG